MTNRLLFRKVWLLAGAVVLYLIVAGWCANQPKHSHFYGIYLFVKDMNTALLALPAAFLTYWFNRRNSYVQALRQFWDKLIPSVQEAIQYTYLESPKAEDFARVMASLSIVIDSLRGVFQNKGADDAAIGLYPYENLKKIRDLVMFLGYCWTCPQF